ncbi:MAG: hypothetical protein V2A74_01450, partial [bacterium]
MTRRDETLGRADMTESHAHLGQEFLTWLWFLAEQAPSPITLKEIKPFELFVLDPLVLEGQFGHAFQTVLRGGDPDQSPEAALALAEGKTVQKLRARFVLDDLDWTTQIQGNTLDLMGLKMPVVKSGDFQSDIVMRLEALDRFWT